MLGSNLLDESAGYDYAQLGITVTGNLIDEINGGVRNISVTFIAFPKEGSTTSV